jgi:hypothetical protein
MKKHMIYNIIICISLIVGLIASIAGFVIQIIDIANGAYKFTYKTIIVAPLIVFFIVALVINIKILFEK